MRILTIQPFMPRLFRCFCSFAFPAIPLLIANPSLLAQSSSFAPVIQRINDSPRIVLKGNVHPLAQARFDRGRVPDSFPVNRLFLMLQRPPEREAALQQFLQGAHTPGNPSFHKWLTPEQFGKLYGPDNSQIAAAASWLQSQGFSIARITKGKTAIEFSGTAGQLRKAFLTEIHTYLINGVEHHANNLDPQIPAALAPIVAGLTALNDFPPKSHAIFLGNALYDPKTHALTPQWTWSGTVPLALALGPADFAVQYDLNPLYSSGITGTGVTIGIIGASDVDPAAIANYRSFFGLPAGTLKVIIDGSDPTPGTGNWATGESYLDVEIASAVAPGATVNLYTAADTSVQFGLLLAAQRAVDDDQASILSTSYGTCEQQLGTAGNQFWAGLWEQAAAQGQTSFVSAGDNGSAGCDDFEIPQPAESGLAVSGFSSTPWNVSVGGTDFYYSSYSASSNSQVAQISTYWNLTATGLPSESLLQPVPEQPWDIAFGLNLYDNGVYNPGLNGVSIVAGSGGASTLYPKPAWQSGTGVPPDRARDLPDVSLFASGGGNGSFYPVCIGPYSCMPESDGFYQIAAVGGTSASSPAMAGILALINQKFGPQGQANFILYPLAAQHPTVFHDITMGSNDVPCLIGSPNCSNSTLNDNTKGLLTLGHYPATPGYDQATGLGSVDANLLVKFWNSVSFQPSTTALSLNETTFPHGTPVQLNISVTGNGGTPTGDIGLVTTATPAINTSLSKLTLQSGAASGTFNDLPGGQYQLTAKYTGDTTFAPSNSSPVTLNVAPEASTVSLSASTWSNSSNAFVPVTNGGSYPYGSFIVIDAQPRGASAPAGSLDGLATGTVTFTDSITGGSVTSGPVSILSLGLAEWLPRLSLPVGSNSVVAAYGGDSSFHASSKATPFTFTVTKAQPAAFLDAKPSPVALGSPTMLNMLVGLNYDSPLPAPPSSTFGSSSPASPTGTVTFSFGNTVLGTTPMVPFANSFYNSQAVLSTGSLPLGMDTVTATYSGDANYLSATSTFNVNVEQVATLSAAANPSTLTQVEFTAITATVTGDSGQPVPTGTVNFFAAGVGSDWSDRQTLKSGSATSIALPAGIFLPGTGSVDVSYFGDSVYGPADVSVSLTVTQGTTPPFTFNATAVTIASPGATTNNTSTIGVTPGNGFTGAVYLSCVLTALPSGALFPPTCNLPASVNISGANAVSTTMTISSTAPSTGASFSSPQNWGSPRPPWLPAATPLAMAGVLLFLGILAQRRTRLRLAGFLFLFAILSGLAGCGGGSTGSGGGGGIPIPGTTAGSYTFTVSGSFTQDGVSQAQTTVTVSIQ